MEKSYNRSQWYTAFSCAASILSSHKKIDEEEIFPKGAELHDNYDIEGLEMLTIQLFYEVKKIPFKSLRENNNFKYLQKFFGYYPTQPTLTAL